jgi:2-amino-4-hydroxy-6-hydroxymethyldihydropteridine diphosphokinase
MVRSLIGLGSNVGDREGNLRRAIAAVGQYCKVTAVSSVYETEPMYFEDQGWFLNCVVSAETTLRPRELLVALREIEAEMGRERAARYGPRVIDLDILFYGAEIVSEPGLEIPHPKIAERQFVLAPLDEISPDLVHPVLGRRVSDIASALKSDKRVVRRPDLLTDLASGWPRRP